MGIAEEIAVEEKTTPKKDHGRRPPPRPASLPLSQFSHGELTMGDIRLASFGDGCSILANNSRHCNKSFPNSSGFSPFGMRLLIRASVVIDEEFENTKIIGEKP